MPRTTGRDHLGQARIPGLSMTTARHLPPAPSPRPNSYTYAQRHLRSTDGCVNREPGGMISDPQPVLLEVSAPDSPILPQVRSRQGLGWAGWGMPLCSHHCFLFTLLGNDESVLYKLTWRGRGGAMQNQCNLPMTSSTCPTSPGIINQ